MRIDEGYTLDLEVVPPSQSDKGTNNPAEVERLTSAEKGQMLVVLPEKSLQMSLLTLLALKHASSLFLIIAFIPFC
jgi:hypothetical protein